METYSTIRIDRADGVLELILDRPESLNPLDGESADEIRHALDDAAANDEVRAVLLRGEGRAFSAGGNIKEMAARLGDGAPAAFFDAPLRAIHDAALALARLPRPVVGALHGFVSGAGFNLALGCDLLLCEPATRFNQAFVRLGLVPDTGGTWHLPRAIGQRRALELLLLGEFVDAERALELGIVNRVVPQERLLDEARALARRLAAGPTRAYAEIRRLVREAATSTLAEALDAEREAQLRVAGTADFPEGVRAFVEKREPRFEGR